MTLMKQIRSGLRHSPPRFLIYGTEGIGKSTTAAQAPKPIFIPTEDGLDQIDCNSFPLARTFDEVMSAVSALYSEQHDYQSVVIDSLDWLERLIWDDVCREYGVKSIEKGSTVSDAVKMMAQFKINRIPVIEDGTVVGIVTRGDIIRAGYTAMMGED